MHFDRFLFQNVVSTSMAHSTAPRAPLFCSLHILTSAMICYWIDTQQHKIYIKWNNHSLHIWFPLFFFCSWTHGCAMKTGSHPGSVEKNNHQVKMKYIGATLTVVSFAAVVWSHYTTPSTSRLRESSLRNETK